MTALTTERQPLRRLRPSMDDAPRYHHPNGWVIRREVRDWDWVRHSAGWTPKIQWSVYSSHTSPRKATEFFNRLRDARAWCDERKSWEA